MKPEFRYARKTDLDKMVKLVNLSFPLINFTKEGFTKSSHHTLKDVIVAEFNKEIAGLLIIPPYKVWILDDMIPMAGIGLVTMSPSVRRRGIASGLMKMAVLECYKQGYPISMLFPFSHQFYKKVGYGLVGEKYVYSFSPLSLTQYDELLNVRLFEKKDLGVVKKVYSESSKKTSFRICRNNKHWKSLTESKDRNVVVYDDKGIKGYLIYKYEYSDNRIEQYLRVYELIYLNDEAYRGLLGFLAAQREQVDSIIYHTTKDDPLHFALSNPRKTRSNARIVSSNAVLEVNADYMLRIVDLKKALLARKDYNNMNLCFSIKVAGDIVEENNKPITVIVKNGKPTIKSGIKSDVVLECDISVFSQIYAGINSEYLHKIQFLKCNKPEVLKEIDEVFKLPAPDLLPLDGF